MKLKPIKDQTIVITGGSSGIGLTTAKMAVDRGANVIILSRDEDGMKVICEDIRADGGKADYVVAESHHERNSRRNRPNGVAE